MIFLNVGCGKRIYNGFVNTDKDDMDIGKDWPIEDESIDGIVGMHVFQQLMWRELVNAFSEAYRVLKKGGVLRMGVPMVEMEEYSLDYLLGWNNITLFSFDLLDRVLVDRIGFSSIKNMKYKNSFLTGLEKADNRKDRGTWYVECIK